MLSIEKTYPVLLKLKQCDQMKQAKLPLPEIDLGTIAGVNHIKESPVLRQGAKLFLDQGYLIVRNAFDEEFIQQAHREFLIEYEDYFVDEKFSDALHVGDKRTMISLKFKGVFSSSQFYANPKLLPLIKYLLGSNCIINSLGSVVSLPGAKEQHIHRDHPIIYLTKTELETGVQPEVDFSWVKNAPPYAITLGIPLVPLNQLTGNTRIWPRTHLSTRNEYSKKNLGPGVDYSTNLGACILFDYRILHTGTANNSDQIRPLLYNIYSRVWFRDTVNYAKQSSLLMSGDEIRDVPKIHRHLFEWFLDSEAAAKLRKLDSEMQRNDPCYCESGLRYKHCHGVL